MHAYRPKSLKDARSAAPRNADSPVATGQRLRRGLGQYFGKMRGSTRGSPPRVSWREILWSWIGSVLGIGAVAWLHQAWFAGEDLILLIGSLGASAVLVYGAPRSPLAQPRNLIGGHLVSAVVGVAAWQLLAPWPWLAAALAVATAIALMHATRTLHPPGGATALIAVIGSEQIHILGFLYCLIPATLGPLILLLVGLVVNNLPAGRRYPETWI
ncbi:HPP family protein [Thiorhodovibrio winogradskyi]|uniref:HPP family protein n=1 Tax=Thiorhodovibrio winogradskyi TaxID=77007 RepID=A0ABZ0SF29_9GAMM|nr:HPP family protein [Thiorhodovibrio winogradskyi]